MSDWDAKVKRKNMHRLVLVGLLNDSLKITGLGKVNKVANMSNLVGEI